LQILACDVPPDNAKIALQNIRIIEEKHFCSPEERLRPDLQWKCHNPKNGTGGFAATWEVGGAVE